MAVSRWRVRCELVPGCAATLRPTPVGIHAAVADWFHDDAERMPGAALAGPDLSGPTPPDAWPPRVVELELALVDAHLPDLLRQRVRVGRTVTFGRAVTTVTEVEHLIGPADFVGVPRHRWRLKFPTGVTFRANSMWQPWPSPRLVLNSIQQRLYVGMGGAAPGSGSTTRFAPRSWSAMFPSPPSGSSPPTPRSRARAPRIAVGTVDWHCTGDEFTRTLVDWLLRMGRYTSVGARTAWGRRGVLEIETFDRPVR